jgi:hypothetical protein
MNHTIARSQPPGALREGTWVGVAMATCIWLWVAAVDGLAGRPFQTFEILGGVIVFTLVHYALNILYGIILIGAVRASEHTPSLIIGMIFGLVTLEIGLVMITVLLTQLGLGDLAWFRIFGGSVVGLGVALSVLARRYPIAARLRQAEEET